MVTIFDRDTLLDLTVNAIPLGIILFFAVGYLIFDPFGNLDLFGKLIMIGLHVVPFVGLLVLTYVSGKAISGDEKESEVYYQGQAAVEDAPTREEAEADLFGEEQVGGGPPRHEGDASTTGEASHADGRAGATEEADEAETTEAAGEEEADDEARRTTRTDGRQ